MRKSSKVISLALSGLMATSCFSMVAASAAQVDADSTGVMTAAERQAAGHQLVFFQFPSSAWGDNASVKYNAKKHTCNVFCNYYAYYGNKGEVKESAWEAPSTSMYKDAKGDSLYYFDITESGKGELEEGADYGVLFSTKANAGQADLLQPNTDGYQTCDMYFNTTCLGTTYHIVEPASKATVRENTANSQKIDYLGTNDAAGQSIRKVSTLCAYIDGAKAGNSPDALEMANALQTFLPNPVNEPSFTWAKIKPVLEKFGASAQDVYDLYVEKYGAKHDEGVQYVHVDGADDLKADGTLKDCYRYTSITTIEIDESSGAEQKKITKYPDFDLVRERLNLPDEPVVVDIDSVAASMDGEVKATEALPTVSGLVGGNYASSAVWTPEDETAAYSTEYTLTVTFTADEGYQFTDATTATLNDKAFDKVELADGKLVATATFKTEDEPVPADTFVVAGAPADIFGTAWDAANTDNTMTKAEDGTYTKDYTVDKAYEAVQLKTVKNGAEWIGDKTGNNVAFDLTGAGTFTVVYYPEENYTDVKGDIVKPIVDFNYDTVFAVGNGEGTWLNGAAWDPAFASNEMTQVADDVWEIEFANVPDGFERQIKFAVDGTWTHNFGAPKEDVPEFESGVTFDATYDGGNITFDTDDTCTVTAQLDLREFDFVNKTGAKYTVTISYDEPVVLDTFIVAGTPAEIFGTAWDATNEANLMTANDDGTYTKDYTVDKAFDVVQLKAVKNGADWYGDETGNNATFALTGAGTFTVTAAPTEDGYVVSVSGDIVADVVFEVGTVYAVGNGEGTWLNGAAWDPAFASNEMTQVAEGVWEIEFANVPDGFERQIKFAIDGAWTHNFGGAFAESGVATDAVYNGDNITFDTDDVCTVKAQLDLREFDFITKEGAKFTVTIDYAPVEEVGVIGDVTGDGNVTIDDATLIQKRGIELEKFDEVQEKLGDVNRDGRISILDVTCVQKYLADYTEGTGEAGNLLLADGRIVPADQ